MANAGPSPKTIKTEKFARGVFPCNERIRHGKIVDDRTRRDPHRDQNNVIETILFLAFGTAVEPPS